MNNHSAAISDFETAIRIEPFYALAFFYMGVSKLKSNSVKNAMADFHRSMELDTVDNPGVYDGMGQCQHKL
jgi:lipoprotein NlpI